MVEMTAASAPTSPGDVLVHLDRQNYQDRVTDQPDGTVRELISFLGVNRKIIDISGL